VTRDGIEARFGELGRIAVRFDAGPKSNTGDLGLFDRRNNKGSRCRGREPVSEGGAFEGRIQFEGENGFTRIDSRRAGGFVQLRYRQLCQRGTKDDFLPAALERFLGKLRSTTLQAQGRTDGDRVLFEADAIDFSRLLGPEDEPGYEFSALSVEHREGMKLTRSVSGSQGSFHFRRGSSPPRTATVTPEQPFTGSAEYVKEKGKPASWSGTLAVRLPGAGLVPLTGPRFRSDICLLTFPAKLKGARCLPGSLPSLGLLSEFGAEKAAPDGINVES
jgi:hypothetical protein